MPRNAESPYISEAIELHFHVRCSPTAHLRLARCNLHRRRAPAGHFTLRIAELDERVGAHDEQLSAIIEAIRQLAAPAEPEPRRKIGFNPHG